MLSTSAAQSSGRTAMSRPRAMTGMLTLYKQGDTVYSCCRPLLWSVSDSWYVAFVTGVETLSPPTNSYNDDYASEETLSTSAADHCCGRTLINWYIALVTGGETLSPLTDGYND